MPSLSWSSRTALQVLRTSSDKYLLNASIIDLSMLENWCVVFWFAICQGWKATSSQNDHCVVRSCFRLGLLCPGNPVFLHSLSTSPRTLSSMLFVNAQRHSKVWEGLLPFLGPDLATRISLSMAVSRGCSIPEASSRMDKPYLP